MVPKLLKKASFDFPQEILQSQQSRFYNKRWDVFCDRVAAACKKRSIDWVWLCHGAAQQNHMPLRGGRGGVLPKRRKVGLTFTRESRALVIHAKCLCGLRQGYSTNLEALCRVPRVSAAKYKTQGRFSTVTVVMDAGQR